MVETRRRDYGTPIRPRIEEDIADEVEEEVDLPLFTVDPPKDWRTSSFGDIKDHGGGSIGQDRYSGGPMAWPSMIGRPDSDHGTER